MATWMLMKQPNGRYARMSRYIFNFTDVNMTESEALDMCRNEYDMSSEQAERMVRAADAYPKQWDQSLQLIQDYYGKEEVDKVMGDIDPQEGQIVTVKVIFRPISLPDDTCEPFTRYFTDQAHWQRVREHLRGTYASLNVEPVYGIINDQCEFIPKIRKEQ